MGGYCTCRFSLPRVVGPIEQVPAGDLIHEAALFRLHQPGVQLPLRYHRNGTVPGERAGIATGFHQQICLECV
jgi:hypothetical protein